MAVSWDPINFEPNFSMTSTTMNKWEGEDAEDVYVKESWEDEDKKDAVPKKIKIQDNNAELKQDGFSKESVEKEEILTAEELSRQKLQKETVFGQGGLGKLDSLNLTKKEEFTVFSDLLTKKIGMYKTKDEFPTMVENLVRVFLDQMPSDEIKKIKMSVNNLYIEKLKIEKNEKSKKPVKGKTNARHKQYQIYKKYEDQFDSLW